MEGKQREELMVEERGSKSNEFRRRRKHARKAQDFDSINHNVFSGARKAELKLKELR